MGGPDMRADAQRVFAVLKVGGIALCPGSVGYFLATCSEAGLEKIHTTKKRGPHKRHPLMGSFELEQEIHVLEPEQRDMIRCLVEDFDLPLAVVARFNGEHPLMKAFDEDRLEASTSSGTVHMVMNVGLMAMELSKLCAAENLHLQGSSANPTGTGNTYLLENIPREIRELADITIDYGLAKYSIYRGLGATILDFSHPAEVGVIRIGAFYDVISDLLKRFWGIELPKDPGRATVPHGNLTSLPDSKTLMRLGEKLKPDNDAS